MKLVPIFAAAALLAGPLPAAEPATNVPPAIPEELVLRPPYPEIAASFYERHTALVWAGAALLALAGLAGTWYLTRPRPKPLPPPEVEARRALAELLDRPETGAVLSRVSHVLRHYFERAFDLGTGEFTTGEITAAAERSERVGPGLAACLRDFLLRCDRLKFAPHGPEPPLGAAAEALRLVDAGEARRAEWRAAQPNA